MAKHSKSSTAKKIWIIVLSMFVLFGIGTSFLIIFGSPTSVEGVANVVPSTTTTSKPKTPFTVTLTTSNSVALSNGATISVTFSHKLSSDPVLPTLSPQVPGSWSVAGDTVTFTPQASYIPGSTLTILVPQSAADIYGQRLANPYSINYSVAPGSVERLQQLLAQLGYLPVSFTPASTTPVSPVDFTNPVQGTFAWKYPNIPLSLSQLWVEGQYNLITKAAVMAFEADHNMKFDGIAGPIVWTALLESIMTNSISTAPYDYVLVTKALPETLQVWRNGQIIYSTLANTGISAAPTADGTFPVYSRFFTTTMSGTNPNGTKYEDPGIPWVSYFNGGDAIHGFVRSSYGFPQSLGCVELPISNAGIVFPMTPIGTLVNVS